MNLNIDQWVCISMNFFPFRVLVHSRYFRQSRGKRREISFYIRAELLLFTCRLEFEMKTQTESCSGWYMTVESAWWSGEVGRRGEGGGRGIFSLCVTLPVQTGRFRFRITTPRFSPWEPSSSASIQALLYPRITYQIILHPARSVFCWEPDTLLAAFYIDLQ